MAHQTHADHGHTHQEGCGHVAIRHGDHVDYLHDGHLHRVQGKQVAECRIEASAMNPAVCTDGHSCPAHTDQHRHGPDCGHELTPHGDHVDYLVAGHLHHMHDGHCDDHGAVETR